MSKLIWVILLAAPLLTLGAVDQLSHNRAPQFFGDVIRRAETPHKRVAFTFDDGPRPGNTERLLDVLDQYHVKATFFMCGENAARHPELVQNVFSRGHQIGNHSWDHPRMVFVSPSFVRDQIDRTDVAIRNAGYTGPIPFRAPHGRKFVSLPWVLRERDRANVLFDVAPRDYLRPPAQEIVDEVLQNISPGSIVVLHDGGGDRSPTIDAVNQLLHHLKADGWEFVTVQELTQPAVPHSTQALGRVGH